VEIGGSKRSADCANRIGPGFGHKQFHRCDILKYQRRNYRHGNDLATKSYDRDLVWK
jgi:hypothetical protein